MSRIIEPFKQFFDGAGDPLINGWLWFLQSGTTSTEKDTFFDSAEQTVNTNPVQLDAEGRCPNVFGTGTYKVILYTNDELLNRPNVQVDAKDPVGGAVGSSDFDSWASTTVYDETDIVKGSDSAYYKSLLPANQNNNPISSETYWAKIDFIAYWNDTVTYSVDANVRDSATNLEYISLVDSNVSNQPSVSPDEWSLASLVDSNVVADYSDMVDYPSYSPFAVGSDDKLYEAKIANGPSSSVVDPVGDSTGTWELFGLYPDVTPLSSIAATVASSALTATIKADTLYFRNATLTNGEPESIAFLDLSIVVPSGATLGTVSAVGSELVLIAINSAGTIKPAIVNMSGGNDLSETGVITTVAIDDTADSNDVFYSDAVYTDVPYRVIGTIRSTQATAGTWITTPSLVQGQGGQALSAMSSIGYGQTWQDLTASRALSTTYYNSSNRPIQVSVTVYGVTYLLSRLSMRIDGIIVSIQGPSSVTSGGDSYANITNIVPPGSSYSIASGQVLSVWAELR